MIQVGGELSLAVKYSLVDPQKEHEDQMYALNKLSELLKKMLLNDKSAPEPIYQSTSDFQREFECPICFEEMRPVFSTLIGQGPTRLGSHWSRAP